MPSNVTQLQVGVGLLPGSGLVSSFFQKFARTMDDASESAKRAGGNFKNLAGAFTGLVVAKHTISAMQSFMKPAIEMETALSQLAMITGESGMALKKYEQYALAAAKATSFNPKDSIDALIRLRQATGDTNSALTMLTPTLTLAMASAGKVTPEKAAIAAGSLIKAWGQNPEQAVQSLQEMAATGRVAGLQLQEITDVMGKLDLAAFQSSSSFKEMMLAFGLARRTLPSTQRAATDVLQAIQDLWKGTEYGDKKGFGLAGLGLSAMDQTTGRMKSFGAFMGELADKYAKGPNQVMAQLQGSGGGGSAGKMAIMALLKQLTTGVAGHTEKGSALWRELLSEIESTAEKDPLGQMADKYRETMQFATQQITEGIYALKLYIGRELLPATKAFAGMLGTGIDWLKGIAQSDTGKFFSGTVLRVGMFVAGTWALRAAWMGVSMIIAVTTSNVAIFGKAMLRMLAGATSIPAAIGARMSMFGHNISNAVNNRYLYGASMPMQGGRIPQISGPVQAVGMGSTIGHTFMATGAGIWGLVRGVGALLGPVGLLTTALAFLPEIIGVVSKAVAWLRKERQEQLEKIAVADLGENWKKKVLDDRVVNASAARVFHSGTGPGWITARRTAAYLDMIGKEREKQRIANALADMERMTIFARNLSSEKQVEAAKQAYYFMQLGSDNFQKVVDRLNSIFNTKRESVKFATFNAAEEAFGGMTGRVASMTPQQRLALSAGRGEMALAKELFIRSQKQRLSSAEGLRLHAATGNAQLMLERLGFDLGDAGVMRLAERFRRDVTSPVGTSMGKAGIDRSNYESAVMYGKIDPVTGLPTARGIEKAATEVYQVEMEKKAKDEEKHRLAVASSTYIKGLYNTVEDKLTAILHALRKDD